MVHDSEFTIRRERGEGVREKGERYSKGREIYSKERGGTGTGKSVGTQAQGGGRGVELTVQCSWFTIRSSRSTFRSSRFTIRSSRFTIQTQGREAGERES